MVNEKDCMSWTHLQIMVKFVADVNANIIYYLGYLENQKPCTFYAYEKKEDLQIFLETHAILTHKSTQKYFTDDFDDIPIAQQRTFISLFNTCTHVAAEKLVKYLADNEGQPAITYLKFCRIFNPE